MIKTTSARAGAALERVNFFDGQIVTAADLNDEAQYFLEKARRHNRFLHGWGVVAGLEVRAAPTEEEPARVYIACGYALSPQGDEIFIQEAICFDLQRCGVADAREPCPPGSTTRARPAGESLRLYLAVRSSECPTRPVRVHPANCGCDASGCAYARIRDDYEVACLLELPATHRAQSTPSICDLRQAGRVPACPPCPEEPWVVIAAVNWNPNRAITDEAINNQVRQQLFSAAMLQSQIIDCCCDRQEPPPETKPATVVRIQPENNAVFTASDSPGEPDNPPPQSVTVWFDQPLQAKTVNRQTFVVRFRAPNAPEQELPGQVTYQKSSGAARFTPRQGFARLVQYGRPVEVFVRVRGSGADAIHDGSNQALDGDGDGKPGGDFTSRFEIR